MEEGWKGNTAREGVAWLLEETLKGFPAGALALSRHNMVALTRVGLEIMGEKTNLRNR